MLYPERMLPHIIFRPCTASRESLELRRCGQSKELCDEAMTAEDTDQLSATQLAQLSLIYMKIADKDDHDDGETVGLAVNAYERAMDTSPTAHCSIIPL